MKNIVLCCDGTWLDLHSSNNVSNIARIHQIVNIKDKDGNLQVNYFGSGIGTNGKINAAIGGYTGHGLDKNIIEAYDVLITHYESGDKVFLFGFSRGAYTVRSLAGLIDNIGLLKKIHFDKISKGFNIYRSRLNEDEPNSKKAKCFREKYSREIDIEFLGVFDTVGALGIPPFYNGFEKFQFHDTTLNPRIKYARQATAIDEKRYDYMPTLLGNNGVTDILERAFPGVHSDVGGGYKDSHGLADIALKWMVSEAEKRGLSVSWEYYPNLKPDPTATLHDSYQGVLTQMLGYHQRHFCNSKKEHTFKPQHSWHRFSQYPLKAGKASCPYHDLQIDTSFFQRKQKVPEYNPINVELFYSDPTTTKNSKSNNVLGNKN